MIGGESDSGTGISIHAPAKGATCGPRKWSAMRWYFNPRSREGSDESSHHPLHNICNFNPRSREGSDEQIPLTEIEENEFQSTLPRRERHGCDVGNV